MAEKKYTVVGMMSGTSLDGMDLILCSFRRKQEKWHFIIHKAVTYEYSTEWKNRLGQAHLMGAEDFILFHHEFGRFIGENVKIFLGENHPKADMVASHGHTIFHQPARNLAFQLGAGASILSQCNLTTISDFRSLDVVMGGQGAPLVPVGDEFLFSEYRYCLNLGGFANISNNVNGTRIACDLCPVNIVLNSLAQKTGLEFDKGGEIGRKGTSDPKLVNDLNNLEFYSRPGPKSLGREWIDSHFMPVLDKYDLSTENLARSVYEHIVFQISQYVSKYGSGSMLVTGGGAFNTFLMERLAETKNMKLIVPDDQIVKFKEALIFAFLGLLRYRNEINCLSSVTGARHDTSSGVIHLAL